MKKGSGATREESIRQLCDGVRTSKDIALILCESQKYVQRTMNKYDLPRLPRGARNGMENPAYVSGRTIDRDGYVLVSAPLGHPHARMRAERNYGKMYEHRLVMEQQIGRVLLPSEVVDHIDGLRLHNAPDNLRLFVSNSAHLSATISAQVPNWSLEGKSSLDDARRGVWMKPVNKYHLMKKSGDARLRQILLAALQLGLASPYLLGTHRYIKIAGIVSLDRSTIERALDDLCHKYA